MGVQNRTKKGKFLQKPESFYTCPVRVYYLLAFTRLSIKAITPDRMKTAEIIPLENELASLKKMVLAQQLQIEKLTPAAFEWHDTHEIARVLKISKRSVDEYRRAGLIPCSKIGGRFYFRISDINDYLLNNQGFHKEHHD
jgi:hypothetical protein